MSLRDDMEGRSKSNERNSLDRRTSSDVDEIVDINDSQLPSADLNDDSSFWDHVRNPNPGSLLDMLSQTDDVEKLVSKSLIKKIFGVLGNPNSPIGVYVVAYLVFKHADALHIASMLKQKFPEKTDMEKISLLTERDIKSQADFLALIREILSYHVDLGFRLMQYMGIKTL